MNNILILAVIVSITMIWIASKNLILLLISFEVSMFTIILSLVNLSFHFNIFFFYYMAFTLISIMAIETALILVIIINFYNMNGSLSINTINFLNG